ncbi:MAG: 50S ribosomal protein L20 [Spirochaetota bacterium]
MPRATTGVVHHKRQRKILKQAKGFMGGHSVLYRTAKDSRRKALQNSYAHRRAKKRDMRSLWITRINAASRLCGMTYSTLVDAMEKANIEVNRKMLAELAVKDMPAFQKFVDQVKA